MNLELEQALLEQAINQLGYLMKSDVCEDGWEQYESNSYLNLNSILIV